MRVEGLDLRLKYLRMGDGRYAKRQPAPCNDVMQTRTNRKRGSSAQETGSNLQEARRPETDASSHRGIGLKERFLNPLIVSKHPRRFNSRGAGIGLAAGFACPIGLQFFVITGLRVLFRFNSILALAFSLVSNPFTVVPLYYVYYRLGSFILEKPVEMSKERFDDAVQIALAAGYFWDTIPALLNLGRDVIIRWSISAVIFAVVFGTVGYLVTWRIQEMLARNTGESDVPPYEERISRDCGPDSSVDA